MWRKPGLQQNPDLALLEPVRLAGLHVGPGDTVKAFRFALFERQQVLGRAAVAADDPDRIIALVSISLSVSWPRLPATSGIVRRSSALRCGVLDHTIVTLTSELR